jgi:hypothetical protein
MKKAYFLPSSKRSPDGAKRNPGFGDPTSQAAPDFAACHAGYNACIILVAVAILAPQTAPQTCSASR